MQNKVVNKAGLSPKFKFYISADKVSEGDTKIRPDAGLGERTALEPNIKTSQRNRPQPDARQLASYATEVLAHQHHTHLFQLVVFGKYA